MKIKNVTVKADKNTTITLTGSDRVFKAFFPSFLFFKSFFLFVVIQGVECNFLMWGTEHNETQEVKNNIAPHSF